MRGRPRANAWTGATVVDELPSPAVAPGHLAPPLAEVALDCGPRQARVNFRAFEGQLRERASSRPAPDRAYVFNFDDPQRLQLFVDLTVAVLVALPSRSSTRA